MDGELIVSNLVVAPDHLLRALDDLVLEDLEPLLKLAEPVLDLALLCRKLWVLADFLADLVLDGLLHMTKVTFCIVKLRTDLKFDRVLHEGWYLD